MKNINKSMPFSNSKKRKIVLSQIDCISCGGGSKRTESHSIAFAAFLVLLKKLWFFLKLCSNWKIHKLNSNHVYQAHHRPVHKSYITNQQYICYILHWDYNVCYYFTLIDPTVYYFVENFVSISIRQTFFK